MNMTYGDTSKVKKLCKIDDGDATRNNEIDTALAFADALVQMIYEAASQTVESTVPEIVKNGASEIGAYYILRSQKPEEAKEHLQHGIWLCESYVKTKYCKSYVAPIKTSQVYSEQSN